MSTRTERRGLAQRLASSESSPSSAARRSVFIRGGRFTARRWGNTCAFDVPREAEIGQLALRTYNRFRVNAL